MAKDLWDAMKSGAKSVIDGISSTSIEVTRKTKVGDLQKQFDDAFHLTLRIYHGANFASGEKTVGDISSNKRKPIDDDLSLRASMTAEEVADVFQKHFAIKARVADADNVKLIPEHVTLGDAHRGEYKPRKR